MEPAQNTNEALNSNQSLDPEKLASLREALAAQPIHRISREVQQTILQLLDAEAPLPEIALDYVFGDGMVPPTSATIECAKRVLAADESIVRETAPAITSILKLFHSKQGPRKNLDLSDDPIVAKHYQRKPGSFPAYQEVCEDVFIDAVAITQTYARNISTEIAIKSLTELRNYDRPAMLSWLSDLSQFPGDFNLLREFFNKAGTYNPFVAKDIMRVVIKRASSDEKLETETEEIASDKKVEAGQLASGGGLLVKTGDHFFALRPDRPEGAFARKRQAFGNIYDLISRGKDAAISTERKQARRDECLQDVISGTDPSSTLITGIVSELLGQGATLDLLKDVTLDAYLSDDTLQEIADRSPLLARNTRLYQELLAEVEALKEARVSLLGRENLYTLTSKNHRQFNILKNPSGTVLSVLGAMINDPSIDVPDSMQSIYHALTSSLSGGLSPAHERLYFAAASSWVGRHVYVERDLGLSDFIADVDYYRECAERKDKLPKDHPIHKGGYNLESCVNDHPEVFAAASAEVPLFQLLQLQFDSRSVPFRKAMNEYLFDRFQSQVDEVFSHLRSVFQDQVDGRWKFRSEHLGNSLNREALESSLYGMDFNRDQSEPDLKTKKQAPLLLKEWRAVRMLLDLERFADGKLDFAALPVGRFEDTLNQVAIACGKARYLELMIEDDFNVPFHEIGTEKAEEIASEISAHRLLDGSLENAKRKLVNISTIPLPEYLGTDPLKALQELICRASVCFDYGGTAFRYASGSQVQNVWSKIGYDLKRHGRVGLLIDRDSKGEIQGDLWVLANAYEVKGLVPVDEVIAAKVDFAARAIAHPLVRVSDNINGALERAVTRIGRLTNPEWYQRPYVTDTELKAIEALWEVREPIEDFIKSHEPHQDAATELVKSLVGKHMIYAPLGADPNRLQDLRDTVIEKDRFQREQTLKAGEFTFTLADVKHAESVAQQIRSRYVEAGFVAEQYPEYIRELLDAVYRPIYRKATFDRASNVVISQDSLVSRNLIDPLPKLDKPLYVNSKREDEVDFVWSGNDGLFEPQIRFGSAHCNKSAFDTAVPDSYFEFITKQANRQPSIRKQVMGKIDELRKQDLDHEARVLQFQKWFIAHYRSLMA